DPVTGKRGSILDAARKAGALPKIFFTTTSTEYWTRAASLLHTDVDGKEDVVLAPETRLYLFSGAQHGNWAFEDRWPYAYCTNGFDHRFGMRALMSAMQRWLEEGIAPPDSVYPTFADGTLGTVEAYRERFPSLLDFRLPIANLKPPRLELGPRFATDGIVDRQPAGLGDRFVTTVPLPDEDGIDLGGIRLPGIAAPLATHTGWNLRRPEIGAEDQLARWSGSMLPFAVDERDRQSAGDPRPSLEARYGSREGYAEAVERASSVLVGQGFLLEEDVPDVKAAALRRFDNVSTHVPGDLSCAYSLPGH
ncbi:MAG: alpha/beta hydrolase domain-containing protein, partial [Geminicoccaceae bacterium]